MINFVIDCRHLLMGNCMYSTENKSTEIFNPVNTLNSNPTMESIQDIGGSRVWRDNRGRYTVGGDGVQFGSDGRIESIGGSGVVYDSNGRLESVGGDKVHYK